MNFRLLIEYDGSAFNGWQRQAGGRTIQGEIEKAIAVMAGEPVTLNASGRTDAGVHALGQVASFRCETRLTPGIFEKGLNSLLPGDIVIRGCEAADPDFHARYSARGKTYRYVIRNAPFPAAIGRLYHWHIRRPLDLPAMETGAAQLLGTHDFKAFEGTGSPRSHTVRTVTRAHWIRTGEEEIRFEISADGFLRYMVRNIVGTLAAVGMGRISPETVREILGSRDRGKAGATAPPQGLFLVSVLY